MDKAALLALADRVEALTGPCFNIEDQIEEVAGLPWRFPPPNYTASLDAAMTLVPEGVGGEKRFLQLTIAPLGCDIVEHRCEIIDTIGGQKSCSKALTGASAITAAALRAIAGGEDA